MWVLRRANFLSSFAGKGLFFLYIAIPLLSDGWQEYKGCVMLWQHAVPCPTTPADEPGAGVYRRFPSLTYFFIQS